MRVADVQAPATHPQGAAMEAARAAISRAQAVTGPGAPQGDTGAGFRGGDRRSRQIALWRPRDESADKAILRDKKLIDARARDLTRNNGFAAGAVDFARDRIVGHRYRIVLQPMAAMLGISRQEAREWARIVEPIWQSYFDDPECYIDASRQRTGVEILRAAEAFNVIAGEAIVTREFRGDNPQFGTCFQLVDPPRLSTPDDASSGALLTDGPDIREGVELGRYGDPIAYHFRDTHPNDLARHNGMMPVARWRRVRRTNEFGMLNVFHVLERGEGATQTRGVSRFAPVIQQFKMLGRMEDAELEAAILAAVYSFAIESEFGPQSAFEALGGDFAQALETMLTCRQAFSEASPLTFDGAHVPHLFPGEKLVFNKGERPVSTFAEYESAMLRHIARRAGMSYEQLSADYSRVTQSSGRLALAESWQHILGRRATGPSKLATLMFRAWLDEAVLLGGLPLPGSLTRDDYLRVRPYLTQCTWIGAGRPSIDELKTANANRVAYQSGGRTLAAISADEGVDWEEALEQQAAEEQRRADLGLPSAFENAEAAEPDDEGGDDAETNRSAVVEQ